MLLPCAYRGRYVLRHGGGMQSEHAPRQLCLLPCPGNGQSSVFQLCEEVQVDLLSFSAGKRRLDIFCHIPPVSGWCTISRTILQIGNLCLYVMSTSRQEQHCNSYFPYWVEAISTCARNQLAPKAASCSAPVHNQLSNRDHCDPKRNSFAW